MLTALEPWAREAAGVAAAFAAGALIGVERGFHLRAEEDGQRVAGLRTFSLIGLAGGMAGLLSVDRPLLGALLTLMIGALLVAAYGFRFRYRADATSAVAAVATLAIALLAGSGHVGLALAAAAIVVLILASREQLHGFVDQLDRRDILAMARFAVIALAVFPFLPTGRYGPYDAWDLTTLWWVVVLVTGFSFAGYIANRLFGARHGTVATALIGGAYSSTAVTQSLSQRLAKAEDGQAESAGIALASAVMYLRVIVLVALLAPRLLASFVVLIAPALVVAWFAGWWLYRRAPSGKGEEPTANPIALLPALGFALFVAVAAVVARWAESRFGDAGIAALLLVMGTMDVDAAIVTAGGLEPGRIASDLAALAIGGTIVANMAVKLGVTLVNAGGRGRSAAAALLSSMVVLALSLVIGWLRLSGN